MRVLYSVFIHDNNETAIYKGVTVSGPLCQAYLISQGYKLYQADVSEMVNGKKWHESVLIIRHEIQEHELITPALLNDLKLRGQKEAKRILKSRKRK